MLSFSKEHHSEKELKGTWRESCGCSHSDGAYDAHETEMARAPLAFTVIATIECSSGLFEGSASTVGEVTQGTLANDFQTNSVIELLNRNVGLGFLFLAAFASNWRACFVYSFALQWMPVAHNFRCCGCSCCLQYWSVTEYSYAMMSSVVCLLEFLVAHRTVGLVLGYSFVWSSVFCCLVQENTRIFHCHGKLLHLDGNSKSYFASIHLCSFL